ncbi:MAG: substrate-binding domain-containing protein [Hespellia sp.]|nr:substrate-binding domain-containing protein [Hespellia sp.]
MRIRKKWLALLAICAVVGTTGCTNNGKTDTVANVEGLDKLGNVQVISREDGSGTRSTFAELAGFAAAKKNDVAASDETTKDAQIAKNAEEVIAAVQKNESAVGYVSKGALDDDSGVKTLSVNGASADGSSKYPLSRSFYLAYSGELNDAEQDFLTYVRGAGQSIVEESYGTVGKSSTFLSNQAGGTITISGSTSVAPLMEELADAYMQLNTNVQITVEESDSSQGLTKAMSGECNFGMASRELKDYESELLDYEAIAKDDIAVIVNEGNPLGDISLDVLRKIYIGDIKSWEELNS